MDIGMLWYEDAKLMPLAAKVERAAAYYREKYGRAPTECHVHPRMLPEGATTIGGIAVKPNRMIIMNHLWLGMGENGAVVA